MANEFQRDYSSLRLAKDASWIEAQSSYRKLVNRWHPDRYANRPRELASAQKQFIELTISFNNLRSFYQTNNRMPFEVKQRIPSATFVPEKKKRVETNSETSPDLHFLHKRKKTRESRPPDETKSFAWAALAVLLMLASFTAMFLMDSLLKQQNLEQAREAQQQTPPSGFLPDAENINKRNNRGAIMDNTAQGKLGDRLMRDVFR